MLFKPAIIAALLIGLSLAAPHPDLAAEPQAAVVAVAEPQVIIAAEPQAGAAMAPQGFDPSDLSIIGDVAWPTAFYRQCNTLADITASFDKQLARAKAKGYSCTPAQAAAIATTSTCPPFNILLTMIWPVAFMQQEGLTSRIAAQVECLAAFQGKFC